MYFSVPKQYILLFSEKIFRELEEIKFSIRTLRNESTAQKNLNSPIFPNMLPLSTESAVREFERNALQPEFKEKMVS